MKCHVMSHKMCNWVTLPIQYLSMKIFFSDSCDFFFSKLNESHRQEMNCIWNFVGSSRFVRDPRALWQVASYPILRQQMPLSVNDKLKVILWRRNMLNFKTVNLYTDLFCKTAYFGPHTQLSFTLFKSILLLSRKK